MEIPSEAVREFYLFRRHLMDVMREERDSNRELAEFLGGEVFSFEQVFWIDFVSVALCTWDHNAEDEIRLSEIFKLYLTIYRGEILKNMSFEDELSFLNVLREKYDEANRIFHEAEESKAAWQLGQLALGEEIIVMRLILAGKHILSHMINCPPMPLRLVKDV